METLLYTLHLDIHFQSKTKIFVQFQRKTNNYVYIFRRKNIYLHFKFVKVTLMYIFRVKILGVNFRDWASITRLDKQALGTLSPHSFNILLVYALQQLKQVEITVNDSLMITDFDTDTVPYTGSG